MPHCCTREFWACFAMWMADKARTPDPETLLFYFLGTWRYSRETWEILEYIMGCISRKRTKQENSWYRMMYLPWQGNVRSKAKKVKEEDLKLPYWKPKVFRENTGFYIHLKEKDLFSVAFWKVLPTRRGNCDKGWGSATLVQQHVHSYEVCCVTGCPADQEQPNSHPVPSWAF